MELAMATKVNEVSEIWLIFRTLIVSLSLYACSGWRVQA